MSDDLTTSDAIEQAAPKQTGGVPDAASAEMAADAEAPPAAEGRPRVTRARATTTGPAKSRQPRGAKAADGKGDDAAADAAASVTSATEGAMAGTPVSAAGGSAPAGAATGDGPAASRTTGERRVLEREGADLLEAADVTARMSVIGRADADDLVVSMGMLGGARADRATVEMGVLGGALAGEVHVTQGLVSGIVARDVHLEQALARNVVAGRVTMGRSSGAFIVLAARVDGEVRSVLDWRAGLAVVSLFALVASIVRVRRLLR